MRLYHASAVYVSHDLDYGEGSVEFVWPDEISGWDMLHVELDGHCSRRMPLYSGREGLDRIELSRDRAKFSFAAELAERLKLDREIEIVFSIPDDLFSELEKVVDFMGGDIDGSADGPAG